MENPQEKIRALEAELAEMRAKLNERGVELEANEGLLKLAMDDMRRIYGDLLKSQSQVMQSDKLATIGLLSAGIVHELNNPLSAVKLSFSLLGTQMARIENLVTSPDAASKKLLSDMNEFVKQGQQCAESMAQIVTNIRTFSRSDKGLSNPEDMNHIIDSVIGVAWSAVKNKVKIDKRYDAALPPTRCNAQQLSQVFLNLLVNASQAMDRNGVITITTSHDAKNVCVKIADTGHGIPPEVKERLFEPFFTTKGEEGTGLGLSITHDIIKKHNGEITVDSVVGKGTTFTILLPIA